MKTANIKLSVLKAPLFLFLISLLLYFSISFLEKRFTDSGNVAKHISKKLIEKKKEIEDFSIQLFNSLKKDDALSDESRILALFNSEKYLNQNFGIYVYSGNDLVFWNNNGILIADSTIEQIGAEIKFLKLENGYFLAQRTDLGGLKFLLLDWIFTNYPLENSFLSSRFSNDFGAVAEGFKISEESNNTSSVVDSEGDILFYIQPIKNRLKQRNSFVNLIEFFLLLVMFSALYILILNYYESIRYFKINKNLKILAIAGSVFLLQLMIRFLGQYVFNFQSELFQPNIFSSGYIFPSLGYLLLHLHAILFIAISFFKDFNVNRSVKSIKINVAWLILLAFLVQILLILFTLLSERIFYHASVPLSFIEFYAQNVWSYSLFLSISLLVVIVSMLALRLTIEFLRLKGNVRTKTIIFIAVLILNAIWSTPIQTSGLILSGFILLFYLIGLSAFLRDGDHPEKPSLFILLFVIFSALLTVLIYKVDSLESDQEQLLTAHKLSVDTDPMFEFLFPEVQTNIVNDDGIKSLLKQGQSLNLSVENEVFNIIQSRYLTGYFERYSIEQTLCTQYQQLIVQPENITINCSDYFESLIAQKGQATQVKNLYLINDNVQGIYYIAVIHLNGAKDKAEEERGLNLYIEFYFKYIPEGLGYPELLIDESKGFTREFANYSFATYQNGILIYKFGSYLYPSRLSDFQIGESNEFTLNDYKHVKQTSGKQKIVIVSKKYKTILDKIAPFSFFFFIIGIVGLLVLFASNYELIMVNFKVTFRMKLQFLILVSLMLSFIVIGISTIYYITGVYKNKNNDFLAEKTQSILIELEHKLSSEDLNRPGMNEYLQQLLMKFSMVFFSDINIFDLNGQLMATSRYEIFDKGLLSKLMNPVAYREMRIKNKLFYLHQEAIGNGKYLSSYIPFKGSDGNAIAYINLPYFAKETEMSNEVSSLVMAYVNVFLLLTGISVLMALFLSRRLTQPLQMVQQKMRVLRIGKINEKIVWKGKDEIGQLINQYNTLLDQLAESADLLARSERESAWRDMAKQVAHEIKNPLTPMRLSAQYLLKAWNENDPDMGQKVERTTQTLINQIDTLSSIASAFSDFANMPPSKPEQVLISSILRQLITLFDNTENVDFQMNDATNGQITIFADPGNVSRVFTNIIKNSIQAIGNKEDGLIEVLISQNEKYVNIIISDNGKGMTSEEEKKVFTPNFTTKTSGMGIGLSIVRNLIITAGGSINFETEQGIGTKFHITLPIAEIEN